MCYNIWHFPFLRKLSRLVGPLHCVCVCVYVFVCVYKHFHPLKLDFPDI